MMSVNIIVIINSDVAGGIWVQEQDHGQNAAGQNATEQQLQQQFY